MRYYGWQSSERQVHGTITKTTTKLEKGLHTWYPSFNKDIVRILDRVSTCAKRIEQDTVPRRIHSRFGIYSGFQ